MLHSIVQGEHGLLEPFSCFFDTLHHVTRSLQAFCCSLGYRCWTAWARTRSPQLWGLSSRDPAQLKVSFRPQCRPRRSLAFVDALPWQLGCVIDLTNLQSMPAPQVDNSACAAAPRSVEKVRLLTSALNVAQAVNQSRRTTQGMI